ncbi:MAG: hypothetical protein ACRBCI_03570 [Cellvibrionaceae bacterium]
MAGPALPAWLLWLLYGVLWGTTIYELYDALDDIMEGTHEFDEELKKIKDDLEEYIKEIEEEIEGRVRGQSEVAFLEMLAANDPQSRDTETAANRWPIRTTQETRNGETYTVREPVKPRTRLQGDYNGRPEISQAIQEKIPFRRIISKVCGMAYAMPLPQLRKQRGRDIPTSKKEVLTDLLREGWDLLSDVELEGLIVVRLRQLTANLIFELIDHLLDWTTPLKCEVWFGGPRGGFADPMMDPDGPATKLKRASGVSPFYPPPHGRGSIGADLVIPERRHEPCEKKNIFAIVEIKFPNDKIDEQQFQRYNQLLARAALEKDADGDFGINRRDGANTNSGGRLSLFRFPEDAAART